MPSACSILCYMRYTIHIDEVYEMPTFSVQIDDHTCQETKILDKAYYSIEEALEAAKEYINRGVDLARDPGMVFDSTECLNGNV